MLETDFLNNNCAVITTIFSTIIIPILSIIITAYITKIQNKNNSPSKNICKYLISISKKNFKRNEICLNSNIEGLFSNKIEFDYNNNEFNNYYKDLIINKNNLNNAEKMIINEIRKLYDILFIYRNKLNVDINLLNELKDLLQDKFDSYCNELGLTWADFLNQFIPNINIYNFLKIQIIQNNEIVINNNTLSFDKILRYFINNKDNLQNYFNENRGEGYGFEDNLVYHCDEFITQLDSYIECEKALNNTKNIYKNKINTIYNNITKNKIYININENEYDKL